MSKCTTIQEWGIAWPRTCHINSLGGLKPKIFPKPSFPGSPSGSHPRLFDSDSSIARAGQRHDIGLEQPLLFLIVVEDEPSTLHSVLIIRSRLRPRNDRPALAKRCARVSTRTALQSSKFQAESARTNGFADRTVEYVDAKAIRSF